MPTISRELFHWSRVPTGIEKLVCEDVANRQALGIAKYGQTVADNPLSLREWLQHGLEEALDMAVYLKRAIAEIDRISRGPARYGTDAAGKPQGLPLYPGDPGYDTATFEVTLLQQRK